MRYPVERFTDDERALLAPHFTNLDRPVFAIVNLPETVKGAMFARYSRYQGTLRRLFLDEFAESATSGAAFDSDEGERASGLYERIFLGFGDDSVAQLGGAHIACEWVSARTSSSRRATSPTTRRSSRSAIASTATRRSDPSTSAR